MAMVRWLSEFEEWKECRATIGRLDTIIADLRKYSFSLVTALITASGLLGQQKASPAAIVAVPIAIMILIAVLFAVDRYYTMLLNGAVDRALDLEGPRLDRNDLTKDALTQVISVYAIESRSVWVAPWLYFGLLVATLILASAMSDPSLGVRAAFAACSIFILLYFGYTEWRRPTGSFRANRFT